MYLLSRQKLPEECRDWIGEDWRCLALDSPLRSFVLHCCLLSILRRYSRAHWKARWKEFDESANFSLTLMNDFECYNENEKSSFPAQFWYRFYMVFFCCCYCWFLKKHGHGDDDERVRMFSCEKRRNRVAFNSRIIFFCPPNRALSAHFNGAECLFAVFIERWYLLVSYFQLFNKTSRDIWVFFKKNPCSLTLWCFYGLFDWDLNLHVTALAFTCCRVWIKSINFTRYNIQWFRIFSRKCWKN